MGIRVRLFAIFIMVCNLVSCAPTSPPLRTVSGNPEITIPNTTKRKVIDTIVAGKFAKGMQLREVTDYGVVMTKRVDNSFWASFIYGSKYDSTPELRIHYNVVEEGTGVRVYSTAEMITNPGSAFERLSDITSTFRTQMQADLQQLKSILTPVKQQPLRSQQSFVPRKQFLAPPKDTKQ